ncbi:hypothetical protein NW761_014730 [Fusarium oxysporum]|nr:hypothetical protein NW758_014668 [Fusarium oxysporum]KAJ4072624.1 hypothetical protein NW761_014730 [Fusarium oxysporum]KAJ4079027.1 hypothetical protein NW769_015139 [Fusarium oxysporum]KAJ4214563.1 hypothetical protein NW760_014712 [Fusarium oxysporum]
MPLTTRLSVFTKLASRLTIDKLTELAIIPVIFIIHMFVSWGISVIVGRLFGFSGRSANFITAVGVFGNSYSLPVSLVLSLSQTIRELHWDRIPKDNNEEVGARGILYLLIFQQLHQFVRWSWGYHVLLIPKDKDPEYPQDIGEEGQFRHEEGGERETQPLLGVADGGSDSDDDRRSIDSQGFDPVGCTLVSNTSKVYLTISSDENTKMDLLRDGRSSSVDIYYFPRIRSIKNQGVERIPCNGQG